MPKKKFPKVTLQLPPSNTPFVPIGQMQDMLRFIEQVLNGLLSDTAGSAYQNPNMTTIINNGGITNMIDNATKEEGVNFMVTPNNNGVSGGRVLIDQYGRILLKPVYA
jgi:hypothetical protein